LEQYNGNLTKLQTKLRQAKTLAALNHSADKADGYSSMRSLPYLPSPDRAAYCWVIVFAGMLALFAGLGLGRFSLGMMLPKMGETLSLSYGEMGYISTANFCGYLFAVLACGRLSRMMGARQLIFLGLLVVGSSMMLVGRTSGFYTILLLYALTGIGSALANVPVMALISTWFEPRRRGRAAGLCVMGNGLGLLVSGNVVPVLNSSVIGWRLSWFVLGGVVLVLSFVCLLLFRNGPADVEKNNGVSGTGRQPPFVTAEDRGYRQRISQCAFIYFLFGCTYVIYITFMVTSLVQERGLSEEEAGVLWSWVGLLSLGSGPLLGYFSDRFSRKSALILVFCFQAAAYLLVAAKLPMVAVYLSIGCFGLVAWSVPTVMAALVGDYAGSALAAAAFGLVTFAFGIGQIAGPAIAGRLAEETGGFSVSFFLAAGLVLAAGYSSFRLPDPRT